MNDLPTPHCRFHFGLRSLFVLVTVVAVLLAIVPKFPEAALIMLLLIGGPLGGWAVGKLFGKADIGLAFGALMGVSSLLWMARPYFQ